MEIKCSSLSEFNDKKGFQLIMLVPSCSNELNTQQFNLCSQFMLPREQLCGKLLALEYKQNYFLIGIPSLNKNTQNDKCYARQKYIYCTHLLVQKKNYLISSYRKKCHEIIHKLRYYLERLQQLYHYVYYHKHYYSYLQYILNYVYQCANKLQICNLTYQCKLFTFINLNSPPVVQSNPQFVLDSVPITNLTSSQILSIQSIFVRTLMIYALHGDFTLKKIYNLHKDYQENQIKLYYKSGVQKGLIFMVDMLNLTNNYILTEKIHKIRPGCQNYWQLQQLCQQIRNKNCQKLDEKIVLYLLYQFNRTTNIKSIIHHNRNILQSIDIIRLIRLSQIFGLLQRIKKRIIYDHKQNLSIDSQQLRKYLQQKMNFDNVKQFENKINKNFQQHINNNDTLDIICTNLEIDHSSLQKIIINNSHQFFINSHQ